VVFLTWKQVALRRLDFETGFRGLLDLFFRDLDVRVFQDVGLSLVFSGCGTFGFFWVLIRFSYGSDFCRIGSKGVFRDVGLAFRMCGCFFLVFQRCWIVAFQISDLSGFSDRDIVVC
jgi:hypothetical protein